MKYTPGPWTVKTIKMRQRIVYLVVKPEEDLVAIVETSAPLTVDQAVKDKDLANATLIAAAPELLEALKRLLDCTQGGEDSLAAAQDQAMSIIAKATAEE